MTREKHPFGHMSRHRRQQAWRHPRDIDGDVFSRIVYLLERRGISLKQVSNDLSIPYRSLQNWNAGRSTVPTDAIRRMVLYLGVEADYFIFGAVDMDPDAISGAIELALGGALDALSISSAGEIVHGVEIPERRRPVVRDEVLRLLAHKVRGQYLIERCETRVLESENYSPLEGRIVAADFEDYKRRQKIT